MFLFIAPPTQHWSELSALGLNALSDKMKHLFIYLFFLLWQCYAHDVLQFKHKHHLVRVIKRCFVLPDSVVTNTAWNCHKASLQLPKQQSLTRQSVAFKTPVPPPPDMMHDVEMLIWQLWAFRISTSLWWMTKPNKLKTEHIVDVVLTLPMQET